MKTKLGEAGIAEYAMPLNIDTESAGSSLALNEFLEKKFSLNFTGEINCVSCNRSIKKSFNQREI